MGTCEDLNTDLLHLLQGNRTVRGHVHSVPHAHQTHLKTRSITANVRVMAIAWEGGIEYTLVANC